jgi:hypothetical protein
VGVLDGRVLVALPSGRFAGSPHRRRGRDP